MFRLMLIDVYISINPLFILDVNLHGSDRQSIQLIQILLSDYLQNHTESFFSQYQWRVINDTDKRRRGWATAPSIL